jgi:hypothetical protein
MVLTKKRGDEDGTWEITALHDTRQMARGDRSRGDEELDS